MDEADDSGLDEEPVEVIGTQSSILVSGAVSVSLLRGDQVAPPSFSHTPERRGKIVKSRCLLFQLKMFVYSS